MCYTLMGQWFCFRIHREAERRAVSSTAATVYWNEKYTAATYAFATTRKSGEIARAIEAGRATAALADPEEHTAEALERIRSVHDAAYVEAVLVGTPHHLAESQGFPWDAGIPTMAVAHAAGLVAAVATVLDGSQRAAGSLSSGLHHARAATGRGYCTFNGLAVAAEAAQARGAGRILVLDVDAHGGGGTRSLCDPGSVVQIDVSTSGFDSWTPATGDDAYRLVTPGGYLAAIDEALDRAERAGPFDLVLYNAGMDPVTDSGVDPADIAEREQRVAAWAAAAGVPLVYALAGGYDHGPTSMDDLVDLHLLTVRAFA